NRRRHRLRSGKRICDAWRHAENPDWRRCKPWQSPNGKKERLHATSGGWTRFTLDLRVRRFGRGQRDIAPLRRYGEGSEGGSSSCPPRRPTRLRSRPAIERVELAWHRKTVLQHPLAVVPAVPASFLRRADLSNEIGDASSARPRPNAGILCVDPGTAGF